MANWARSIMFSGYQGGFINPSWRRFKKEYLLRDHGSEYFTSFDVLMFISKYYLITTKIKIMSKPKRLVVVV